MINKLHGDRILCFPKIVTMTIKLPITPAIITNDSKLTMTTLVTLLLLALGALSLVGGDPVSFAIGGKPVAFAIGGKKVMFSIGKMFFSGISY